MNIKVTKDRLVSRYWSVDIDHGRDPTFFVDGQSFACVVLDFAHHSRQFRGTLARNWFQSRQSGCGHVYILLDFAVQWGKPRDFPVRRDVRQRLTRLHTENEKLLGERFAVFWQFCRGFLFVVPPSGGARTVVRNLFRLKPGTTNKRAVCTNSLLSNHPFKGLVDP